MKTKILSMIFLLATVLMWAGNLSAQNVAISVGNVSACPGTTNVTVPIVADNLNNVGSISLSLLFNNANVTYTGYISSPTIIASGVAPLVNNPASAPNKIIISWFSLSPIASFPSGDPIFTLKFTVNGSSNFNWDLSPQSQGACEISDGDGIPFMVDWYNGSITAALPDADFTSTPSVCAGQDATVSVDFTSGTAPFTIVYNDGVNPNDTVVTSDDPYTFTSTVAATTTWNLVSVSTTACANLNVNKSTTTTLGASPTVFAVTGGGAICPGGAGAAVGLDNSEAGATYELFLDGISTGLTLSGTGAALNFGDFSVIGTYTISAVNTCSTADMSGNAIITESAGLTVTLDPFVNVCSNILLVELSGGLPAGGIYSGVGVLDGNFYPIVAGPGTHTIAYTIVENGCTGTASQEITVVTPPLVTINAVAPLCSSGTPVEIVANPEGGIFSGTGVVGNTFDPAVAGPGNWEVVYTYTSTDGVCQVSVSVIVTVTSPADIVFEALAPVCENATAVVLSASPSGGAFSGTGVENGEFVPGLAGVGTFTITYTFTDESGCVSTASQDITVNNMTEVVINPLGTHCENAASFFLTDDGLGGTFSGPGVTMEGSFYSFDPSVAGPGTHTIYYELTEANGCYQSDSTTVTVNSLPVASYMGTTSICEGSEATITLDIAGNGPYFVTVADGSSLNSFGTAGTNDFIVNPATTTTYTLVSVTDINGCSISPEIAVTITVVPLPVIVFDALASVCANAEPFNLSASPVGGSFSGPGVTDGQFNPSAVNPGTYTITYSYADENNCSSSASQDITVLSLPVASVDAVSPMCQTADAVTLVGTPAGGIFSGEGVFENSFNPALAGPGMHTITYAYTDMNGCAAEAVSITIEVFETPVVTFEALPAVCASSGVVTLIASPLGGAFSGTGVTGNTFDPAISGIGTFAIVYSYTDMNGCSNSASQEITVTASPEVVFMPLTNTCVDGSPIMLVASPSGGSFSGTGIMDGYFYPQLAGSGTYTLTYTYSLGADCSGSASQDITVYATPDVTIDAVSPMCASASAVSLTGTPAGGVFTGNGVSGSTFDPAVSGAGTFSIEYSYTDLNGCNNVAYTQITVYEVSEVTLSAALYSVCANAGPIELTGSPAGGVYSGTGVSGNFFYPSTGVGEWTVTYSYTSEFGCSASAQTVITVNGLPEVQLSFPSPVCHGSDPVLLTGTPAGGVFSGDGVDGNFFYPSLVNPGEYLINYFYSNESGCSADVQQTMTVLANPVIVFAPLSPLCAEASAIVLDASPAGGIFSGTGVVGNTFDPSVSGSGTFMVTYTYGAECIVSASQEITVTSPVVANAGDDVTITSGNSTTLSGLAAGGTEPYSYSWTPATGLNDPSLATVSASPLATTAYTLMVMDANNCMAVDEVIVNVIVSQNMLSGYVTYPNASASPLANVQVTLKDISGVLADQTTYTDGNGFYSFLDLETGSYNLQAAYSHPWGGGNATDGLIMLRHFTGLTTLTGIKRAAGDVSGNGYVSSHDALNTLRRFLGTLASFAPVGDWTFDSPTVVMDGLSNKVANFNGLCMGDVNADYNVNGAKSAATVMLIENGSVNAINGTVELPVIAAENMTVGSFSMILNLAANVQVNAVSLTGENTNLSYSIEGNELKIGWYSLEPMTLVAGQTLFTLSLKAQGSLEGNCITLDGNSVITDEMANTIENAQLLVPKISTAAMALNFTSYPNPVISKTTFNYTLAESGMTQLELYNALGDRVAVVVNEVQDAGMHSISFDASSLAQGIYLSRLTVNGLSETKTITINR